MTRLLGIDWDQKYLRLVEAKASKSGAIVQQAWLWEESVCPNPAQAEEAGKRLKERLREAGIAPAPVRFVIGRDGVICRDVLYPDVPANEVPAIVGFQTTKELTIPADEAVIDFIPNGFPGPLSEKRALAVVVHAELLAAIRKTCQVAGLKLEAVLPSGVGHAALWSQHAAATGASGTTAVLALGESTGEVGFVHDGKLLFTRSLIRPQKQLTSLIPELRRTLAAFATLYPTAEAKRLAIVGESTPEERAKLAETLGVEVVPVDPLPPSTASQIPPERRGLLAGAVGAVLASKPLSVNFLDPKRTLPPPSRKPLYYAIAAAVGVVFLVGLILYWMELARRNTRIEELQLTKQSLQKQIEALSDADKKLEAINAWASTDLVLLDELYDLIAGFPDLPNIRITKVTWTAISPQQPTAATPTPGTRTPALPAGAAGPRAPASTAPAGPKPVARVVIQATGDAAALERLRSAMSSIPHWKLDLWEKDNPSPGSVQATLKVFPVSPKDYDRILAPPRHRTVGMPPPRRSAEPVSAEPFDPGGDLP
ncbi:MAG: hypothetical protein NZM31_07790 [Gemmatales bacterium]|nr:hypothetical protein [Gemmatales bacterium]MDW8386897.1 hypothetical protein [Gemmatales bacterium]